MKNFQSFDDFINEGNSDLKKAEKVLKNQIDIPRHKVQQVVNEFSLLAGAFGILDNYGIPLNNQTLDLFIELLSAKLSGNLDVEFEWSKKEYDNLMKLKTLSNFQ